MGQKVIQAQNISRMCTVCGEKNPFSLKAKFYDLESGELLGLFYPTEEHQSYPGRLHGGFISAILDELVGRAINCGRAEDDQIWGVTMKLEVRFRKPVPLDGEIRAIGRITKETGRTFEGTGEIVDEDGTVLAEAAAVYAKLPPQAIAEGGMSPTEWFPDPRDFPGEIEV